LPPVRFTKRTLVRFEQVFVGIETGVMHAPEGLDDARAGLCAQET
jgi:hypothetical protein